MADNALTRMTSGRMRNAKTIEPPGDVSSNGSGAPPKNPNTKDVPASVARISAFTPSPIHANAS